MLVQQIIKSKGSAEVVTISPTAEMSNAVALLCARKIGAVVVSQDGKSADGILSERDIIRALGSKGQVCLSSPVSDYMTKSPVCAAPGDSTDAVLEKMSEGRFRHMPVTDNDVLVGLISIGDVVKARLDQLSMEKDALQGMIMGH